MDTQVKNMMHQIKEAIEKLESLEQGRRNSQHKINKATSGFIAAGFNQLVPAVVGPTSSIDNLDQQGAILYLNERLAALATLHKDQYEARIATVMEKRESSLHKAVLKQNAGDSAGGKNRHDPDGIGAPGLSRRNHSAGSVLNSGTATPTNYSHSAGNLGQTKSSNFGSNVSSSYGTSTYQDLDQDKDDFEQRLTAEERQMLQVENEHIVQQLETELNQV
ncbi:hypothetical protein BG004_007857, partial [Podila humilis]